MLSIRLTRTGKKGQPNYRIIVTDSRNAVYAPYIEMIGHYDPRTKKIVLNAEKATEWMNKGAKPTNTVAKLLEKENVKHKSIVIKKYRKISKKELERIKAEEEVQKAKEQAEKEAAKEAHDAQVEAEKEENKTVDPLLAAADEAIAEDKAEAADKAEEKAMDSDIKADTEAANETATEEVKND